MHIDVDVYVPINDYVPVTDIKTQTEHMIHPRGPTGGGIKRLPSIITPQKRLSRLAQAGGADNESDGPGKPPARAQYLPSSQPLFSTGRCNYNSILVFICLLPKILYIYRERERVYQYMLSESVSYAEPKRPSPGAYYTPNPGPAIVFIDGLFKTCP
jgi:hypothetical protein